MTHLVGRVCGFGTDKTCDHVLNLISTLGASSAEQGVCQMGGITPMQQCQTLLDLDQPLLNVESTREQPENGNTASGIMAFLVALKILVALALIPPGMALVLALMLMVIVSATFAML